MFWEQKENASHAVLISFSRGENKAGKMNVILHNVIEPTAEDGQSRKSEDVN